MERRLKLGIELPKKLLVWHFQNFEKEEPIVRNSHEQRKHKMTSSETTNNFFDNFGTNVEASFFIFNVYLAKIKPSCAHEGN